MKLLQDALGVVGFGLLIGAAYLYWGTASAMAVAGSGLLLAGLLMARARGGRA